MKAIIAIPEASRYMLDRTDRQSVDSRIFLLLNSLIIKIIGAMSILLLTSPEANKSVSARIKVWSLITVLCLHRRIA